MAKVGEFISNVQQIIQQYYQEAEEKGKLKGYEEGIQEGIQRKAIEIAEKMIIKGYSDEQIQEFTELDIEKIKELRRKHNN